MTTLSERLAKLAGWTERTSDYGEWIDREGRAGTPPDYANSIDAQIREINPAPVERIECTLQEQAGGGTPEVEIRVEEFVSHLGRNRRHLVECEGNPVTRLRDARLLLFSLAGFAQVSVLTVRRWRRDKDKAASTLHGDLKNAHALVTHMSAAANEALLAQRHGG